MGFLYRLERPDGSPAEPPLLETATSMWRPGDTIPLSRDRTLRVLEIRPGTDPVLVVEKDGPEGAAA
jgi:hypothetical protein